MAEIFDLDWPQWVASADVESLLSGFPKADCVN